MTNDKYKQFRNFLFNDLGITKGDVRQWTREAVQEVAERRARSVDVETLVKHQIENVVSKVIRPMYGSPSTEVKDQIRKAVAETLAENLTISVREK